MQKLINLTVLFFLFVHVHAQLISIPLDFSFNQSERFDDDILVTVSNKDSFTVLQMDSRKNEMPFFYKTYYLIDTGIYNVKIVFKNVGEADSLIKNYTFNLSGKEEQVRFVLKCSFDTLDKKNLIIFRNNKVNIERNVQGNPARLELKRLWKKPIRRDSALFLPYEIYNPSDKLLYTNEDNGVEFMLEQFSFGRWQYLNCGAVLRLGKPFKPQQRYSIVKDGFVNGCDLKYLRGNRLLRLKASYHLNKPDSVKKEKLAASKTINTYMFSSNFTFYDEFEVAEN